MNLPRSGLSFALGVDEREDGSGYAWVYRGDGRALSNTDFPYYRCKPDFSDYPAFAQRSWFSG